MIVRRRKKTLFDLCIMSRNEKRVLFFFPANYGMHVTISSRVLPSEHCTPHTTHARDRSETYLASARRAWRADGLAAPAHRAYRWLQTHGAYQAARASRSARRPSGRSANRLLSRVVAIGPTNARAISLAAAMKPAESGSASKTLSRLSHRFPAGCRSSC